ncbi:hypothetical protein R50073_16200 [Maricurvus nonylphenolicus]|uniref:substrate-binding periplasmic protein n=1 Tax=Maricurvus nonylphenolicus TaxID=1008307 RepID=UPI0036F2730A
MKNFLVFAFLSAIGLPVFGESSAAINSATINIGIPGGHPPWLYRDENTSELKGVAFQFLDKLFAGTGLSPEIHEHENFVRLAAEVIKGTVDAGPFIFDDKEKAVDYPQVSCAELSYGRNTSYLYALEKSEISPVDDIAKLYHLKIATTRVIDTHRYMPGFPKNNITLHRNPDDALKMIISGRSDMTIIAPQTAAFWKKRQGIALKPIAKVVDFELRLCFSHASLGKDRAGSYAKKINANIAGLIKASERQRQ